jgi:hypothetical protein
MLCKTHRRTSGNTEAKTNKDKQCYTKHIEERQTIPWPKPTRTNNVIRNTSGHGIVWRSSMCFVQHCLSLLVLATVLPDVLRCVLYYIVCPFWVWQWYCLTFFGVFCITLLSDNTMAKPNKDKRYYTKHIEERQTIPWPKPTRRNNVIQNTPKNVRQYHCQTQKLVLVSFGHGIVWRSSICFV